MRKVKFLLAFLTLFVASQVAFGQIATTVLDYQEDMTVIGFMDPIEIKVEWYGYNGEILEDAVNTTVMGMGSGITLTGSTNNISFYPILSTRIYVTFLRETHFAIYPGYATEVNRAKDPQYWIVEF